MVTKNHVNKEQVFNLDDSVGESELKPRPALVQPMGTEEEEEMKDSLMEVAGRTQFGE